ncbi:hypothetical protein GJ496_001798 [Pomphorhynchus laevis]|nr:hypothetical protein GJ496_001798 [Pomphorhynchus laevis]
MGNQHKQKPKQGLGGALTLNGTPIDMTNNTRVLDPLILNSQTPVMYTPPLIAAPSIYPYSTLPINPPIQSAILPYATPPMMATNSNPYYGLGGQLTLQPARQHRRQGNPNMMSQP